jgi:hypothetical protein
MLLLRYNIIPLLDHFALLLNLALKKEVSLTSLLKFSLVTFEFILQKRVLFLHFHIIIDFIVVFYTTGIIHIFKLDDPHTHVVDLLILHLLHVVKNDIRLLFQIYQFRLHFLFVLQLRLSLLLNFLYLLFELARIFISDTLDILVVSLF